MTKVTPPILGLERYELDDPEAGDPFSRRLARENRWSPAYTARVIHEYKRFIWLAATSAHPVSPSDAVDQVWHLHILYTEEYRRFCRSMLGRRLDHTPSRGGARERERFTRDYQHTLDAYRAAFHDEPPAEIWPSVADRFTSAAEYARVDIQAHWVVRKPDWLRAFTARVASRFEYEPRWLALLGALASVGCVTNQWTPHALSGPAFLGLFLVGWFASLLAAVLVRQGVSLRSGDAKAPPRELDPYETAYLAGQSIAAVDAAVAVLLSQGSLSFDEQNGSVRARAPVSPRAHTLEAAVHAELPADTDVELRTLRTAAARLTEDIAERLKELGLIQRRPSRLPLYLALAAPALGVGRILSRLGTDRPVGALVFLCIVSLIVAWVFFHQPAFRTPQGEALHRELMQRHAALPTAGTPLELASLGLLPVAVGLFGFGLFPPSSELDGLRGWLSKAAPSRGDCGGGGCGGGDGGGGDGGGGCGGGCGGCGGCGGE